MSAATPDLCELSPVLAPADRPTVPAVASAPELAARLLAGGQCLVLLGLTHDGDRFRPSDWAERLASAMAQYRPGNRPGKAGRSAAAVRQAQLGYSPLVVPSERAGTRCVIIDPRLCDVEPLAWSFCLNFARDNGLKVETA